MIFSSSSSSYIQILHCCCSSIHSLTDLGSPEKKKNTMTSSEETITEMPPEEEEEEVEMEMEMEMVMEKKEKCYPPPLASHEEVVMNPVLFMNTLRGFHSLLGTRLMIPVIGGKELDLHILYIEVTKRGGFEKVVIEKKWREVSTVFRFSPTATSASYVLRKYYLSLLHHYEQVYFFKVQGPLFIPSVGLPKSCYSSTCSSSSRGGGALISSDLIVSSENHQSMEIQEYQFLSSNEKKKKKRNRTKTYSHLPTGSDSTLYHVLGTIDGKFDCGYLVSVKLGSEILRGVLYHLPELSSPYSAPPTSTAIVPYNPTPTTRAYTRRRRRRRKHGSDPGHPKPNRSGYNFFFSEKHSKLKSLYPNREREFTKMIGESWGKLSDEERMVYQNIGLIDKERYKREMKEYKERLMVLQPMEVGRVGVSSLDNIKSK